jgi:hypothetical protein
MRTAHAVAEDATIANISAEGCCVEFRGTTLTQGAFVVLRIEGLETLECQVRWVGERKAGLEFRNRLYGPVVDHLRARHGHPVEVGPLG